MSCNLGTHCLGPPTWNPMCYGWRTVCPNTLNPQELVVPWIQGLQVSSYPESQGLRNWWPFIWNSRIGGLGFLLPNIPGLEDLRYCYLELQVKRTGMSYYLDSQWWNIWCPVTCNPRDGRHGVLLLGIPGMVDNGHGVLLPGLQGLEELVVLLPQIPDTEDLVFLLL